MPHTITYRGPRVLVGALAHLLREEGVEFDQPRENRTEVVQVAMVVLAVRAGDKAPDRTLDAMIEAACWTHKFWHLGVGQQYQYLCLRAARRAPGQGE